MGKIKSLFEWKKRVQRKYVKECARKSHIFQHFIMCFFSSVTCTHSGEGKQKAIYAARYQIAFSWRGPSPSEAVSVWKGGDACKSASNRSITEQSDFFLIRKETWYQIPFRSFSCCFFLKYCITLTKCYLAIIYISDDANAFTGCFTDIMVILQKSYSLCHSVMSGIVLLSNNFLFQKTVCEAECGRYIKQAKR